MRVGIVGLGLMGGSMAKSVKNRTGHTVYGIDLDQETMMLARMCGAIDGPLTEENLPQCDLILVAIRPIFSRIIILQCLSIIHFF